MPVVRNGWRLVEHPAFGQTLDALVAKVMDLRSSLSPEDFARHPAAKLLARVRQIIEVEVPRDPNRPDYRLKGSLSLWRRVKFNRRYRLFFRFDSNARIIAYCWLNNEATLRKAGAGTDPYAVFTRMLAHGRPPETWTELQQACADLKAR